MNSILKILDNILESEPPCILERLQEPAKQTHGGVPSAGAQ